MGETPSNPDAPERRPGPPPPARELKPTPVRDALADAEAPSQDVTLPGRSFTLEGQSWWAQELGRTRTGRREDPGALLLLIGFRPADADAGAFQREALVQGDSLEAFTLDELAEVAAEAGPFRPVPQEPGPFFGPPSRPRGEGGPPPGDSRGGRRGGR